MLKSKTSGSAIKHVSKYVEKRARGVNKEQSALQAGYAPSTARVPSIIEATQAYALVVSQMLTDNGQQIRSIQKELDKYVDRSDADALFTMDMLTKSMLRLAQMQKILSPQVTVKETTDKNGNKTRTVWGNTATGSIEAPQSEE